MLLHFFLYIYILVVLLYHHLYCYSGCKVSIRHQDTVKYLSYATKGGDGLRWCVCLHLMKMTVLSEITMKWRKQCESIYLQSFQEEEFRKTCLVWNWMFSHWLKKHIFTLSIHCTVGEFTVTLQMIIFSSVLATVTKTVAIFMGEGLLAVGHL